MWKASAGHAVTVTQDVGGADDWETDPDFVVRATALLGAGVPDGGLPGFLLGDSSLVLRAGCRTVSPLALPSRMT